MLWKLFRPHQLTKSIFAIDLPALKQNGVKGLLLDLDDTLVPRETKVVHPAVEEWIQKAKGMGFRLFLISNSIRPKRVVQLGRHLGIPYSILAFKPLPFGFFYALRKIGLSRNEVVLIGDQVLTDVLGGNLYGIKTILVEPMSSETFWPRKIMRRIENWIIERVK